MLGCRPVICVTADLTSPSEPKTLLCWAQSRGTGPQSFAYCNKKSIKNQRWRKTPRAIKEGSCGARPFSTRSPLHRLIAGLISSQREKGQQGGRLFQTPGPTARHSSLLKTGLCTCFPHICISLAFWLSWRNLSASALFDSVYYRCCHGNDLCKN